MSYTTITIGGKERGWKFNQMAELIFKKKTDPDFVEATVFYALVFAGLKGNAYVKGEELDLTFEQVCDGVDEMNEEEVIRMTNAFQETQLFKRTDAWQKSQQQPEDDTKKNLVSMSTQDDA